MDKHEEGDKIPDPRDKAEILGPLKVGFPGIEERRYQNYKKRLMRELYVGFESEYITKLIYGDGELILINREKT